MDYLKLKVKFPKEGEVEIIDTDVCCSLSDILSAMALLISACDEHYDAEKLDLLFNASLLQYETLEYPDFFDIEE